MNPYSGKIMNKPGSSFFFSSYFLIKKRIEHYWLGCFHQLNTIKHNKWVWGVNLIGCALPTSVGYETIPPTSIEQHNFIWWIYIDVSVTAPVAPRRQPWGGPCLRGDLARRRHAARLAAHQYYRFRLRQPGHLPPIKKKKRWSITEKCEWPRISN